MTRLPSSLQPLWPLAKRVHRAGARGSGAVGRRTRALQGDRPVPAGAYLASADAAAAESAVTLHGSLDTTVLDREPAVGDPGPHWIFERRRRDPVREPYTLEIADGLVVGDYAAVVTPGGMLDYETSPYFGLHDWREHPVFLRRRLPEPRVVDGTVAVLATRGGGHNFYHLVIDVLPKLGVLEQTMGDVALDAVYVPAHAGWQRDLLAKVGLDSVPVLPTGKHSAVRARRLLVPSLPNVDEAAPPETVAWLRKRLRPQGTGTPPRIYVTRGDAPRTRRMVREAELLPGLEQRGFTLVDPTRLSQQEQIDVFAGASVVVAPHGAALTNLVHLQPGSRVLEIFAPTYVNPAFWAITQAIGDITYRYLLVPPDLPQTPGRKMMAVQDDIDVDPRIVLDAVDRLLADA